MQQACRDRCARGANASWSCANCPVITACRPEKYKVQPVIASKPMGESLPRRAKTSRFD